MTTYITVVTNSPDSVPAYLYGGVEILRTVGETSYGSTALLLSVAEGRDAEYQAGRLNSGLHASRVHSTIEDAEIWLADTFGVTV